MQDRGGYGVGYGDKCNNGACDDCNQWSFLRSEVAKVWKWGHCELVMVLNYFLMIVCSVLVYSREEILWGVGRSVLHLLFG